MGRNINKALKNGNTRELVFYCMLPFGYYTITTMVTTALNYYFTDVLQMTMGSIGIIILCGRIWDAINDPLMGFFVDKTKSKWGKCRPYILWTSVPMILVTAFLFFPINFKGNGNFIFVLCAYLLFYTAEGVLDIPSQGLAPLVFPESGPRIKAIATANVVGSLGTILPSTLFFTFAALLKGNSGDEKQGFFYSAIIFAVLAGVPLFLSFFGIKEKVYIPDKESSIWESTKILLTDKKMVVLIFAFLFNASINVGAFYLPHFATWNCIGVLPVNELNAWLTNFAGRAIEIDVKALLIPVLQIGSGISYMLSMALVPRLLKRTDKKTLLIYISIIGAIASLLTYLIGVYIVPYNTTPGLVLYIVLRFFTNFPVGSTMVLFIALFADITDDLEMKHGERLEGAVFSFRSVLNKVSFSLFNMIMLAVVGALGYDAEKMKVITNDASEKLFTSTTVPTIIDGVNYTTTMNAVFFMLTALSAIGLIMQVIPMLFFQFDEKAQEEKLRVFREKKERRLNEEIEAEAKKQGVIG